MTRVRSLCVASAVAGAFSFQCAARPRRATACNGIFDGVKNAFQQEVSVIDDERVTPFGTRTQRACTHAHYPRTLEGGECVQK